MKTFALVALLILSVGANIFLLNISVRSKARAVAAEQKLTNTVSFASAASAVIGFNAGWEHADPEQFGRSLQKHFASPDLVIEMTKTNLAIHKLK